MNEITNDQTASCEFDEVELELKDKTVLIIGSGQDIDGRRMKNIIDGNRFDIVARVNKMYGNEQDIGTRTDFIFTRWQQWVKKGMNFFTDEVLTKAKKTIILNQHVGYSESEKNELLVEVGHENVSAGVQSIHYFLNRDVRKIYLIGFGHFQDGFRNVKKYCQNAHNYPNGMTDTNQHYNWKKEQHWMKNQSKIVFL